MTVASAYAHEETGSFRVDLDLDDYQADDIYDLIVATNGYPAAEKSTASYEFRAPAAKATAALPSNGPIALQGMRLRAKGTTVTRPQFASAEEKTLTRFGDYLKSRNYEPGVAASVRDGLAACKGGTATPFERLQLLSAITARVEGLNPRGYGRGEFRLLDIAIGSDTVVFKLESTDGRKQVTTQEYVLSE